MNIVANGIDVSKHNGVIDWKKVKAAGVQFAMIRAGYGQYAEQKDPQFDANVKGAQSVGIPFGFYWYSYAKNAADAKKEAEVFLQVIKGLKPEYPVAFDIEDPKQSPLSNATLNSIVRAFCDTVEAAGYYVVLYSMLSWLTSKLGNISDYDVWLAHWVKETTYKGEYGIWQYTDNGRVNGIAGNGGKVDMNYAYKDYPALMRKYGFNGFTAGGTGPEQPLKKTVEELANEVIAGVWDNSDARKKKLADAGYDYDAVQKRVNEILSSNKKAIDALAKEVINGKWGNGLERKRRLTAAGYDYATVQARVNQMLKAK